MSVRLYHQVGHFPTWNLAAFREESCGDGLILSPVHQPRSHVIQLDAALKRRALFDPQYYLPNSTKPKLASYNFFPEQISSGFSTQDFPLFALQSAQQCVAFQIEQDFEGLIVPARFIDQMASKYFERQEEYTIHPFLRAIEQAGTDKPVYLTLPVTSGMLQDEGFRTDLLNWATGFADIAGIYLLVNDERSSKQIKSVAFLSAYLSFAMELAGTGLKLILGHLNTESLLFSLIDGVTLTFGSFENTRWFSIDKFIEAEAERRAPKARIYLPTLLNWVQYDQALQIRNEEPALWGDIYVPTPHSEAVLAAAAEPYFTQPGLYRHHFVSLNAQIRKLAALPVPQRFEALRQTLKAAIALHRRIEEMPLDLDPHGNGEHLPVWLDCLNGFYRSHLKP